MDNLLSETRLRQIIQEEIAKAIAPSNERTSSAPPCKDCVESDRVVKGTNFKGVSKKDGKTLRRVRCRDCGKTWNF